MLFLIALAFAEDPPSVDLPGDVNPDRHWDVTHLALDIRIDPDARSVSGTSTLSVSPLGRPYRTLRVHAADDMEISEVTVDGSPVEIRRGRETVDVPVPPNAKHEVTFTYATTPGTGMHFRGDAADTITEVFTQGEDEDNRYWFPSWDHPSDTFTVTTAITVPKGLTAIGVGKKVDVAEAEKGWTRWTYELDQPIVNYLVTVVAGQYKVVEDEGPVPLQYVVPRGTSDAVVDATFGRTPEMIAYYEELLDHPYPYPLYRQVIVQRFLYGGMENPTLTTLNDRLLVEPGDRWFGTDRTLSHEVAHQWFGDLLTTYGWRELWLNEGFAEFYEGRWQQHHLGDEDYALAADRWRRSARRRKRPMSPRGWSPSSRDNDGVYVKGAMVLHMLRVMFGDAVFDAAIRDYVEQNAHRLVESDDLRRVFEDHTGTHLGWFFDQFVHGVGHPTVESSWAWAEGELTVVVEQTTEDRTFAMPVQIEVDGALHQVWLGEGEAILGLSLEEPPDYVAIDPRIGVLAAFDHEQPVDAWIAQLGSEHHGAQLAAIRALGDETASEAIVDALARVATDTERYGPFRQEAVWALGKLKTPEATTHLIALAQDKDPYVRERAVDALGEGVGPDRAQTRLILSAKNDDDPIVRGSAMVALAEFDEKEARRLARGALRSEFRESRLAARVLGSVGEISDLNALIPLVDDRFRWEVRYAAASAATKIVTREELEDDHKQRQALVDGLLAWLDDAHVDTRQAAIWLLRSVGEDRAERELRAFAKSNTVFSPDLTKAAQDAAGDIRKRGDAEPEAEDDEGADEITVDERLEELEERLERLEEWRY